MLIGYIKNPTITSQQKMANKLGGLVLLLLLSAFQEMIIIGGEAAKCEANSKLFKGVCWRSSNCGSICENEGFLGGKCKFWKCVCFKECTVGGGGGPPELGPPSDEIPVEGPPTDDPPIEGQPGEGPPIEGQPVEGQPGGEMPPAHMRQS